MIETTALESSTELSNVLLQSSGGSLSPELLAVVVILAIVVLGIAWILWGGAGGAD